MPTLTPEEVQELEAERAHSRLRCKELNATIVQLNELLNSYKLKHSHFAKRYKDADRELNKYKVTKLKPYKFKEEQISTTRANKNMSPTDIVFRFLAPGKVDELIKKLEEEMKK